MKNQLLHNYSVVAIEVGKTDFRYFNDKSLISVSENESKKVVVIVWLSNIQGPQDWEQAGTFEGNVTFSATSGARITGTMSENVLIQNS